MCNYPALIFNNDVIKGRQFFLNYSNLYVVPCVYMYLHYVHLHLQWSSMMSYLLIEVNCRNVPVYVCNVFVQTSADLLREKINYSIRSVHLRGQCCMLCSLSVWTMYVGIFHKSDRDHDATPGFFFWYIIIVQFGCYQHRCEWKVLWCSSTVWLLSTQTWANVKAPSILG